MFPIGMDERTRQHAPCPLQVAWVNAGLVEVPSHALFQDEVQEHAHHQQERDENGLLQPPFLLCAVIFFQIEHIF